jgi:uncharacterized cupin superfamily protein
MPKIDIGSLPMDSGTGYPPPYERVVLRRERKRLGNAAGLEQFGVNLHAQARRGRGAAALARVGGWVGLQT